MSQRYNTDNPVPSSALTDLNDNLLTIDEFVNKTTGEVVSRKGGSFPVLQDQVAVRIDGLTSEAQQAIVDAQTAAENSAASAASASGAAAVVVQQFRDDLSSSSGGSFVTLADERTIQTTVDYIAAKFGSVMPEDFNLSSDTANLLAAAAYAKTNGVNVHLKPGKTYLLTGNQGIEIDLGYFSFGTVCGRSSIDATQFTGPYALWIHSSKPYPSAMYENTTNKFFNVELFGDRSNLGVTGWLLGNNNDNSAGTYNGQCIITHCSVYNFDSLVICTDSTWRYKFSNCMLSSATSYMFHAPVGLLNSGESITFLDCQISDSKHSPFVVNCDNFTVAMYGTSVLNTPMQIDATGATIAMTDGSNIENPGATAWYRYVSVNGPGSRFILDNSTLNINSVSLQTQPPFYVGLNSFVQFKGVRFPGNAYLFHINNSEGVASFVEGPGFTNASGNISDITAGAGNFPIHNSINKLYNADFELGNTDGWTINNSGSPSQTAIASTSAAKIGTYGLRLTSISALSIYATQNIDVSPGQYFTFQYWGRVLTAGSTGVYAGSINIDFYSYSGVKVSTGSIISNLPILETDWDIYGIYIRGVVPRGASYATITIRSSYGAVVDVDSVIINVQ